MTNTNDIQKARDVLAKWRNGDVVPWQFDWHDTVLDSAGAAVAINATEGDALLIVGTAGNPDLLDALYSMLGAAESSAGDVGSAFMIYAERIATAILSADERMSA